MDRLHQRCESLGVGRVEVALKQATQLVFIDLLRLLHHRPLVGVAGVGKHHPCNEHKSQKHDLADHAISFA
jgi:glutamine synthetase type III